MSKKKNMRSKQKKCKKHSYNGDGKSQAISQVNDCGNGDQPIDVFCQNLASQIQGDDNHVNQEGEQGNLESEAPVNG